MTDSKSSPLELALHEPRERDFNVGLGAGSAVCLTIYYLTTVSPNVVLQHEASSAGRVRSALAAIDGALGEP